MKRFAPVFLLVLLLAEGTVWADSGYYGTVTLGVSVTTSGPDANPLVQFRPESGSVYAGPYNYYLSNPVDSSSNPGGLTSVIPSGGLALSGFCIQLTTNISPLPQTYPNTGVYALSDSAANVSFVNKNLSASTITTDIERLMTEYSQAAANAGLNPSVPTVNNLSTALQYAIWEITTETTGTYNVGNWQGTAYLVGGSSGTANATYDSSSSTYHSDKIANLWLDDMGNFAPEGNVYALVPTTSGGSAAQAQAIMISLPTNEGGPPKVPEPVGLVALGSLALCCIPLGGSAIYRRLRGPLS